MTETKRESGPDVPYGTHPRRPMWPLVALIVVFAAWFAALVWMAVRYPAH